MKPDMEKDKLETWIQEYESRSLTGKLSFLVSSGISVATSAVDSAINETAAVVARAKKSFEQGLDPNLDDAKVLSETSTPFSEEPPDSDKDNDRP